MRILQSFFTHGMGGIERHAVTLANALAERHEVMVLTWTAHDRLAHGDAIREWLSPKIRLVRISHFSLLRHYRIARRLRLFQPDIIHAHGARAARFLSSTRAKDTPLVATLHMRYAPIYRKADAIVCVGDWQIDTVPVKNFRRVEALPNWIDPAPRLTLTEIANYRASLGIDSETFLIGAVGRLNGQKGFDLLLKAFAAAQLPKAKLIIYGEGEDRALLQKLATENVIFAGFDPAVRQYMQAFDLLVAPSRFESSGLMLIEAMDAGIPILASTDPGCAETLQGQPVHWTPVDDVPALTAALTGIASQPRQKPAYNLTRYSRDTYLNRLEGIYRGLIEI